MTYVGGAFSDGQWGKFIQQTLTDGIVPSAHKHSMFALSVLAIEQSMVGLEKEGAPLTDLGLRPDEDIPDDKIAGPFEQLGVLRNQLAEAAKAKAAPSNFQIRPGYDELFRPDNVKEVIHDVLHDGLRGKVYSEESADVWAKSIADNLRNKVRDMGYPRYKLIVQVVLGEQQGAGIKIASRCLWDADSDNYASYVFMNETIFCMAAVYAVYYY